MQAAQNLLKTARKTYTLKDLIHHEKYQYKNLMEMLLEYPSNGVGFRIAKKYWPEGHYVKVLQVTPTSNRLGKVYGMKYVDGKPVSKKMFEVDRTTTRGLWRYDLGDSMADLGNGLVYTLADFENHYKTVKQVGWKRPADLRKNMNWELPEGKTDPVENRNINSVGV